VIAYPGNFLQSGTPLWIYIYSCPSVHHAKKFFTDTTYNVVLYPNGSEMMTGLTAEDFEKMYGYIPEDMQKYMQDYMGGNMGNGDMMGNGSDWMNYEDHMSGNHDDNDDQ